MASVEVSFEPRKSAVLSGSDLPCLEDVATINVTRGCAHGCVYCYAQGYSNYPGKGRVVVYANLAEKAADEFRRKRRKPTRAYFSPSCDAFQPIDAVLDATFGLMAALLDRGVYVAFLTKGAVPERFFALFARRPKLVHAQIGLTTLNARIAARIEPGAAPPAARIENIRRLSALGIPVALRTDPLLPSLTDTDAGLSALFAEAHAAGATSVSMGYIFLRRSMEEPVLDALRTEGAAASRLGELLDRGMELALYEGGHRVLGLPTDFRRRNYERIRDLAAAAGLPTHICGCKNRDVTSEVCHIAGEGPTEALLF